MTTENANTEEFTDLPIIPYGLQVAVATTIRSLAYNGSLDKERLGGDYQLPPLQEPAL